MKIESIISFIFLVSSLLVVCVVSDDYAYGLWNINENQAAVGIIDLSQSSTTVKYTFNGYQHVGRQNSVFNPSTQQLQFVLYDSSLGNQIIATIDVTTWKEVLPFITDVESSINFTSLSTTSNNQQYNLFSTYTDSNAPGGFYIGQLSVSTDQFNTAFGSNGQFSSSVFINGQFINVWSNFTTNQPMVSIGSNQYNYQVTGVNDNLDYTVSSTPYNLVYIESTKQVIGNINLIDKLSNVQYAQLFVLNNPQIATIENLSINIPNNGLKNCNCFSAPISSDSSIIYAVYESDNYPTGFSLVKWDITNSSPLISFTSFQVDLFNMFIITQ